MGSHETERVDHFGAQTQNAYQWQPDITPLLRNRAQEITPIKINLNIHKELSVYLTTFLTNSRLVNVPPVLTFYI